MGGRRNPYFRKLLVGFDGSPQAERAVEVGLELASCLDAELLILAVAHLPKPATIVEVHATLDDARERYTVALNKLVHHAREDGLRITTEIAAGHPAEQIIHRAEKDDIDVVLLGRRKRFTLSKLVAGSISEKVLKHAHCPVMIVT
jgi:nucleotide-binding universal stress UspA family protein